MVSRFCPYTFTPTSVRIPVESILILLIIGCVQPLVTPGICIRQSASGWCLGRVWRRCVTNAVRREQRPGQACSSQSASGGRKDVDRTFRNAAGQRCVVEVARDRLPRLAPRGRQARRTPCDATARRRTATSTRGRRVARRPTRSHPCQLHQEGRDLTRAESRHTATGRE